MVFTYFFLRDILLKQQTKRKITNPIHKVNCLTNHEFHSNTVMLSSELDEWETYQLLNKMIADCR